MPLSDDELYLAKNCYGYGRWSAKYWFIGWEQGLGKSIHDTIPNRAKALRELDTDMDGLCDLCAFHAKIKEDSWCRQNKPALQSSWRYLILLLMAFFDKKKPDDIELRQDYQRDHWGRSEDETCLIELSGIPSASKKLSKAQKRSMSPEELHLHNEIQQNRLIRIDREMEKHKPEFVVIYDNDHKGYWLQFWKDSSIEVTWSGNIATVRSSKIVFTRAPAQSANSLWIGLGNQLRQQA
jgi:hypothetical protein